VFGVASGFHFIPLSAERTHRTYYGSSWLKTRNKSGGNGENPVGNWKSLVNCRKNLLGEPALLVRCGGGKRERGVHFKELLYYSAGL